MLDIVVPHQLGTERLSIHSGPAMCSRWGAWISHAHGQSPSATAAEALCYFITDFLFHITMAKVAGWHMSLYSLGFLVSPKGALQEKVIH